MDEKELRETAEVLLEISSDIRRTVQSFLKTVDEKLETFNKETEMISRQQQQSIRFLSELVEDLTNNHD